jgi:hypothetical protein
VGHDYAADRPGQQIAVLLAGAVTAASDLGLAGLREGGADITVGLVDDGQPVTRAAIASQPALARSTTASARPAVSSPTRCCAARQPLGGLADGLPRAPRGYLAAQKMIARFSGRLTASHEELLYVLRKPENRFARLL